MSTPQCRKTQANNLTNQLLSAVSAASNIHRGAADACSKSTPSTFLQEDQNKKAFTYLATLAVQPKDQRKLAPTLAKQMAPSTTFLQQYDAHVCLYRKHGEVYSEWEGLIIFLLKMQEFDGTIQVLLWQVTDHNEHNLPLAISCLQDSFFDLQTYAPCLASTAASWTTWMELGCTRHPLLFLSSSIPPEDLVKKIGPWL